MVFKVIDKSVGDVLVAELDKSLSDKTNQHFMLFYMEGCGPCNATRPEWNKMNNVLSKHFLNRKDIYIGSVDQIFSDKLKYVKSKPSSFPTMRYITNSGNTVENFEDSAIPDKSRTIDCFIDWIKLKTGEDNITKSDPPHKQSRQSGGKTKRRRRRSIKRKSIKRKSIKRRRRNQYSNNRKK